MNASVCYSGFWAAPSGMGEAARNIVAGLHAGGAETTTELVPNQDTDRNLGPAYKLCQELNNQPVDYNIKIIHITPDLVTKYMEPLKYHVFHLFWETSHLPDWWVWALNLMDEIWTGSEWNKKVFINSGVKTPIWVCPQPLDTNLPSFKPFTFGQNGAPLEDRFIFYNIFQWIERKDPKRLLQAYWEAFTQDDKVALFLKTYKRNFSSGEQQDILKHMTDVKQDMGLKEAPPVYLFTDLMSRGDIYRIHTTGDCLVSSHRGEGFGIPIGEAMVFGNPVISTNLGGIHEHIPDGHAYLVDYDETNVFNMDWVPWYEEKQSWATAKLDDLKNKMRYVYDNREEAGKVGKLGQQFAKKQLSYKAVGERMVRRLKQIEERL